MEKDTAYEGMIINASLPNGPIDEAHIQIALQDKESAPFYVAAIEGGRALSWAYDIEGRFVGFRLFEGSPLEKRLEPAIRIGEEGYLMDERGEIASFAADLGYIPEGTQEDYLKEDIIIGYILIGELTKALAEGRIKEGKLLTPGIIRTDELETMPEGEFGSLVDGCLEMILPLDALMDSVQFRSIVEEMQERKNSFSIEDLEVGPQSIMYFKLRYFG